MTEKPTAVPNRLRTWIPAVPRMKTVTETKPHCPWCEQKLDYYVARHEGVDCACGQWVYLSMEWTFLRNQTDEEWAAERRDEIERLEKRLAVLRQEDRAHAV